MGHRVLRGRVKQHHNSAIIYRYIRQPFSKWQDNQCKQPSNLDRLLLGEDRQENIFSKGHNFLVACLPYVTG